MIGKQGIASRRQWLVRGISGLAAILSAAIGTPAALYILVPPKKKKDSSWADAGNLNEVPLNRPQQVQLQRVHFDAWKIRSETDVAWVVRTDEDHVTAFSPRCTHLGCAYRWEPGAQIFLCPCHGSKFSSTGAVLSGPASRPLDQYAVKVEGDRLWLGDVESGNGAARSS
jgi:menaquinol-cytochrome c reductase iron-sulfur subunit